VTCVDDSVAYEVELVDAVEAADEAEVVVSDASSPSTQRVLPRSLGGKISIARSPAVVHMPCDEPPTVRLLQKGHHVGAPVMKISIDKNLVGGPYHGYIVIDPYIGIVNLLVDNARRQGSFEQRSEGIVEDAAFANDSGTSFRHHLGEHDCMISLAKTVEQCLQGCKNCSLFGCQINRRHGKTPLHLRKT
jgi:hypothetical protein